MKKNSFLLLIILVLFLGIHLSTAEQIEQTNKSFIEKDTGEMIIQFIWNNMIFTSIIFILLFILIIILALLFIFKKNLIWILPFFGGLIGTSYMLIPFLFVLNHSGGDPGPFIIYFFPSFWLAGLTLGLFVIIVGLLNLIPNLPLEITSLFNEIVSTLNLIAWMIIGVLIGNLIKKKKTVKKSKKLKL